MSPHTGYAAQRHRSPAALAAAIALNGSVVALMLVLPATRYIRSVDPKMTTRWIDFDVPPPKHDPAVPKKQTEKPRTQPRQFERTTATKPVVALTDGDTGAITTDSGSLGFTDGDLLRPPLTPPHEPLFVKARLDPRYADSFKPDYPPAMRRLGQEASITVRIIIDEQGRVIAIDQIGNGNAAFFEATERHALRYWRFQPATRDGKPVRSEQTLTLRFRLQD